MFTETGADRAHKRLKAKLARNAEEDKARAEAGYTFKFTRQQLRASIRRKNKNLKPAEFARRRMAVIHEGRRIEQERLAKEQEGITKA
jgi:DNA-binding response OmpR family regulator